MKVPGNAYHKELPLNAAEKLWPDGGSPLGKLIPVGDTQLRVVGVLDKPGDDKTVIPSVFIPVSLAQTLLGNRHRPHMTHA